MAELTDKELEVIVDEASKSRPTDNDILDIKNFVEVDEDAELEKDIVENDIDSGLISAVIEEHPDADISLFDIGVDDATEILKKKSSDDIKDSLNLTDEEAYQVVRTITEMGNNKNYNVYDNLPNSIRSIIDNIMKENNISISNRNNLSRMVMTELIKDNGMESALIDFQKSLDEALKMPSIMDLYSEHTKTVMEKNIPEMIERIKDEAPDKAEMLEKVKDAFIRSYNFSSAIEAYNTNTRLRKAIRRYDIEFKRALNEFNFRNEKSSFKMNDVRELPVVLNHILIDEPYSVVSASEEDGTELDENNIYLKAFDMNIDESDIKKFCILICKSCEDLNPDYVIDAAYMYYMMKNIIILKHTQESKTDFAVELINNICDTIAFIRNKEAEFNECNLDKSKHTKKSSTKKYC